MFHALGQAFTDVPIGRERFMAMKQEGTLMFGSLPLLEDGEFRLAQGPVILGYLARKHGALPSDLQLAARADAIALGAEDLRSKFFGLLGEGAEERQKAFVADDWRGRWLPSLERLLARGGAGFFVGERFTHADIAVWDALDGVLGRIPGATLDGFPGLIAFRERIAALPGVAEYLQRRAQQG
jgi:glutathione S-transferase